MSRIIGKRDASMSSNKPMVVRVVREVPGTFITDDAVEIMEKVALPVKERLEDGTVIISGPELRRAVNRFANNEECRRLFGDESYSKPSQFIIPRHCYQGR